MQIVAQNGTAVTNELKFKITSSGEGYYITDMQGVKFALYKNLNEAVMNLNDLILSNTTNGDNCVYFFNKGGVLR